jgi:hypothetical protein
MKQGMALMADSETSELVPLQRQNAERLKDRMKQERTDKIRKLMLSLGPLASNEWWSVREHQF